MIRRMTETEDALCGKRVSFWDGEYEGECKLPSGHIGDHWDGMSWYDDEDPANLTDHLHESD
jgi:hypothetical protein